MLTIRRSEDQGIATFALGGRIEERDVSEFQRLLDAEADGVGIREWIETGSDNAMNHDTERSSNALVGSGLRSSAGESVTLEEALSGIREEFAPLRGVRVRIFVIGQPKPLNPAVREQVYQIGREALVNAMRHSEATNIEAEVEYSPRRVRVVVRDNGCGIDPRMLQSGRAAHWGLLRMREWAGNISAQLRIRSRPGMGTEVEISVPCHAVAAACG
jgi:signal transduction histidine kinase